MPIRIRQATMLLVVGSMSCLATPTETTSDSLTRGLLVLNGDEKLWGTYVPAGRGSRIRRVLIGPCDLRVRTFTPGLTDEWHNGSYYAWGSAEVMGRGRRPSSGFIEHRVSETVIDGTRESTDTIGAYLFLAGDDPGEQRETLRLTPVEHPERRTDLVKDGPYVPSPGDRWCLDGDGSPLSRTGERKKPFDKTMAQWRELQKRNAPSLMGHYREAYLWGGRIESAIIGPCSLQIEGTLQPNRSLVYTWIAPYGHEHPGILITDTTDSSESVWAALADRSWSIWEGNLLFNEPRVNLASQTLRQPEDVWRTEPYTYTPEEWTACFADAAQEAASIPIEAAITEGHVAPGASVHYSIEVRAPTAIFIGPVWQPGQQLSGGDVHLEVLSTDGATIAPDRDGTIHLRASGRFLIGVRGRSGATEGSFVLMAIPLLTVPSTMTGTFGSGRGRAFYGLVAAAGESYQLTRSDPAHALRVSGPGMSNGTIGTRETDSTLTFTAPAAGTYSVTLWQNSGGFPYTLGVTRVTAR